MQFYFLSLKTKAHKSLSFVFLKKLFNKAQYTVRSYTEQHIIRIRGTYRIRGTQLGKSVSEKSVTV